MGKEVISGIVTKVENLSQHLSFVTLEPIAETGWSEMKTPVYMELDEDYIGRIVDIVTTRNGLFGGRFHQSIETANSSNSMDCPYHLIKKLWDNYED
ncbi:MAG: hypothetical protein AABX51_01825 [Nanoarchaeota archaeon]